MLNYLYWFSIWNVKKLIIVIKIYLYDRVLFFSCVLDLLINQYVEYYYLMYYYRIIFILILCVMKGLWYWKKNNKYSITKVFYFNWLDHNLQSNFHWLQLESRLICKYIHLGKCKRRAMSITYQIFKLPSLIYTLNIFWIYQFC